MKLRLLLILMILGLVTLTTGCFFNSSSNPVSSNAITETQPMAQTLVKPSKLSSQLISSSDKPFTFAKSGHKIGHRFRENIRRAAGSLKFHLYGASSADNIFITLEKMKVKPKNGQKTNVNIDSKRIDLLSATDLSEVLSDAELPEGEYTYMEFSIKNAEIALDGKNYNMLVPARKIRFFGSFEIKDGYTTNLKVKLMHRIIKFSFFGRKIFIFIPIVRISSELVLKPVDPQITDGDLVGFITSLVDASKLSGINVSLDGTTFSAVTDAEGQFSFNEVPAGAYTLKSTHPDYLNDEFSINIIAGQIASAEIQLNPAVIRSTIGTTGWFSQIYPLADAHGQYGETSVETPVEINFSSLAFTRAEIKFTGEYHTSGAGRFQGYIGTSQQVSADADLGTWWAGNSTGLATPIGEYYSRNPGVEYTVDVTDLIRSNPSTAYFFAAKNMSLIDLRISNIQLSIYYQ